MNIKCTHYVTLQECKRVFESKEYGIVRFHDMISNPDDYGFTKLLVLGVSIENIPIHFRQYYFKESEISLSEFLNTFWSISYSSRYVKSLKGKPENLIIDRRMEKCINKPFFEWLKHEGVNFNYSTGKDKKFISTVRQHQCFPYLFSHTKKLPPQSMTTIEPYPLTLEILNKNERKHNMLTDNLEPTQRDLVIKLYSDDKKLFIPHTPFHQNDLDVNRSELSVKTPNDVLLNSVVWNNSTIEPFNYGFATNNYQPSFDDESLNSDIYCNELLIVLSCLEYKLTELSKKMNITFLNKTDYLSIFKKIKRNNYKSLMLFNEKEKELLFSLSGLDRGHPQEHIIYNISKLSVLNMVSLWNYITYGGDLKDSFEIRPQDEFDDPAFRMFVVITYTTNYFLVSQRASRICHVLDSGHCINHSPEKSLFVRNEDYSKMLTCVLKNRVDTFASRLKNYLLYS